MSQFFFYSFLTAAVLTGFIRQYAIKKSLIDIPNQRSSHEQPVPRGGGLVIVLIVLCSILFVSFSGWLAWNQALALIGGGGLVAAIGWLDDHRDVSAGLRALVHFLAAIWTLYWLGGFKTINLGFTVFEIGWMGSILAVLGIVWLINLYNFMDGTDGIAALQAITAGSFAVYLFLSGNETGLGLIMLAMIAASSGFLLWNWSPARIFMGDAGSGFLGYIFAGVAIMGEQTGSAPVLIWSILLALFLWDAILTLFRRFRAGEKWYAAHRSHAYQRFVQLGNTHEKLALWFLVINVMLLWPLAWVAMNFQTTLSVLALLTVILCTGLWLAIQRRYDKEK